LNMALAQRKPGAGLIFHSDQGTVYGSNDYRELLQTNGVLPSMSRVGDYIETYYNKQRLHQTLGYQTPAAVEAAFRVPK
ncbi:DDE-type integrase/transposase/recombinase, partial [Massilia varians]|uniref:DDE-type integrase/transposase/recombinase n=1 Tax=Massilia varians TaxID=457921 RepID=UPI00361DCF86